MKKHSLLNALFFLFAFISLSEISAQNLCNANWSKQNDPSNNKKVYFTAALNDTNYRYLWTFGDGTSSDSRLTFRIYANSGKYKVCLKVTKKDSTCVQTICDSITVGSNTNCNANWTKQNDPTNSKKIYFTATLNDTNYRYLWTFGDGTSSDSRLTFRTYANSGKYKVCLKVTKKDSTCVQTICDSILVGSNTNCNANWTKQNDPTNSKKKYFTATLNDTNYRYLWTFGDNTSSDSRLTFHTYATGGKYKVCLKVTKKDSTCVQTICDSITIETPVTCNANWTKQNDPTNSKKKYFTATLNDTNYRYLWTFGDGTSSDSRLTFRTYLNNGKYKVCLKITKKDSTCVQTICDSILVGSNGGCNANFNIIKSDSVGANPHYVRFANTSTGTHTRCVYNFGDGTSSDNCNPLHNFATLGSKTVCLTIYNISPGNDTLCKSTTCKTFNTGNSNPIACVASFDYERIGNTSSYRFVNRSAGSPLQYRWVFDGGAPITTTNVEHNFMSPGWHTACLYVVNMLDTNCKSSYCVSVLFPGNVTQQQCAADFSFTPDNTSSGKFEFSSISGTGVVSNWNFGDGTFSQDANGQHIFTQNGTYSVCLSVLNSSDSCSDMHCEDVMVTNVSTGLGLNQMTITSIYPNPVEKMLQVELNVNRAQDATIRLIDLSGRVVIENSSSLHMGLNTLQLDMSQYNTGIYLLHIQSGEEQIIRKIMK